jgi:hypothetical protein
MCYNLRQGGSGGFDYINQAGLNGATSVTADDRKRAIVTRKQKAGLDADYQDRIRRGLRLARNTFRSLCLQYGRLCSKS